MNLRRFTDDEERAFSVEYTNGTSTHELARRFSTTHHTILSALRRQGVKPRTKGEASWSIKKSDWSRVTEPYLAGQSTRSIAKILQVHPSTIWNILKRAGVPIRNGPTCIIPLKGKKRGHFTVLEDTVAYTIEGRRPMCLVQCDCGNQVVVERIILSGKGGRMKHCGCVTFKGDRAANWKGVGQISGSYLKGVERSAKTRGLEHTVSPHFLWDLFNEQGGRCILTGRSINFGKPATASLDRIDSSQGYNPGNVQWVHKDVNKLKQDFPEVQLMQLCQEIVKFSFAKLPSAPPPTSGPTQSLEPGPEPGQASR